MAAYCSSLPEMQWPALPGPVAAQKLSLLLQFEQSQWWSAGQLLAHQARQLALLLEHAHRTVPYYASRQGTRHGAAKDAAEALAALPILTRRDVQEHFPALRSTAVPPGHGSSHELRTSGSTGMPVRIVKTALAELYWQAITLRDHFWHRRDFAGRLAAIRRSGSEGEAADWGPATHGVVATGPSATLGVSHDVDAQLRWLEEQQAQYLLTYPSNLAALAERSLAQGRRLPGLREARTFGELLPARVPDLCRAAWDVEVTDLYSAVETGYLALQCPEQRLYHVQSEAVAVEVLDAAGRPCGPGETGRIVVTPLHNFAMPLLRYEMDDFAEVAPPCACGRGLPALRRIVGRVRNMLVTASGARYWPALGTRGVESIAPVQQYQLVQKSLDWIEARVVAAQSLTAEQERRLTGHLLSQLPAGLRMTVSCVEEIPRSAGGKFEDFVSEVAS